MPLADRAERFEILLSSLAHERKRLQWRKGVRTKQSCRLQPSCIFFPFTPSRDDDLISQFTLPPACEAKHQLGLNLYTRQPRNIRHLQKLLPSTVPRNRNRESNGRAFDVRTACANRDLSVPERQVKAGPTIGCNSPAQWCDE